MKSISLMTAAFLVCAWLVPISAPATEVLQNTQPQEAAKANERDLQSHQLDVQAFTDLGDKVVFADLSRAFVRPQSLGSVVLAMCLAVVSAFLFLCKPRRWARAFEDLLHRLRGRTLLVGNIGEAADQDIITMKADATSTTRYLLVKVGTDARHYAINGLGDLPIGTQGDEPAAIDDEVQIRLLGKGGTKKMIANAAMTTTGVPVFAAAAGKIALSGAVKVGTLLSTAAADGSVVTVADCEPVVNGFRTLTAATVLTAADSGTTFLLGTAGGFDITLPALATVGWTAKFIVLVAPTTAYTVTGATADKIVGHVLSSSGAAEDSETTAGGDVVNFVANTAVIGDTLEINMDGTLYLAKGTCAAAGGITITG